MEFLQNVLVILFFMAVLYVIEGHGLKNKVVQDTGDGQTESGDDEDDLDEWMARHASLSPRDSNYSALPDS